MRGPTDPYSWLLPGKDHFTSTEENRNGSLMVRCSAAPSTRRERARRCPGEALGLQDCPCALTEQSTEPGSGAAAGDRPTRLAAAAETARRTTRVLGHQQSICTNIFLLERNWYLKKH